MASIRKIKGKNGYSWEARVRRGGNSSAQSFKTQREANEWAIKTEAHFTGRTFAVSRDRTVADLVAHYRPLAKRSTAPLLAHWERTLGSTRLRDLTPPMIARQRDSLVGAPTRSNGHRTTKPRSGSTVAKYLCALSSAFKYAICDLGWCDQNPVVQVRKPPASKWRRRFLSDGERNALLEQTRPNLHLHAAVLLSLSTGIRQGELYKLTWSDLDTESRWAILPECKNGDPRGVPLTENVLAAILALPRRSEHVFDFDLTKAWRRALQAAQIEDFRWHDLRHSAASQLIVGGANHVQVAELLGHKTLSMVKRYAHLANHHKVALVDSIMTHIA
jgi:integrase